MIHIIYDANDTTAWYPNFLSGLRKGLEATDTEHRFETQLPARPEGPIFLTRYTLYDSAWQTPIPPGKIIIQEHEVLNPFTNAFSTEAMRIYEHPSLKAILVGHPSMAPWAERWLPAGSITKVLGVGFPYDPAPLESVKAKLSTSHTRQRLVVFPGRLDECYQPFLAVRLGLKLLERGFRVVMASPTPAPKSYPVKVWQELGIEVGQFSQLEYYSLLSQAQAAISCPVGGNLTLALYEAHLLGATPIIAQGDPGVPPFTGMYRPGFDLLHPEQALEMIDQRSVVTIDETWFSAHDYVERLRQVL